MQGLANVMLSYASLAGVGRVSTPPKLNKEQDRAANVNPNSDILNRYFFLT